ncbi:unnamed protein product [Zymoseptoria tritici ST99CH_3D1]|uniref:Uncharacterized protein n=2 Tax=Zymoseptoria TaxID=1047167 RepID=A0A0F4G5B8_9PEZI|nr:hypothetical protein TI39_contig5882g00001 [Zymoseptoria brevis]SMQ55485.1 unnamed protein product [Zymoseptoria tritici ST99CH_3D7]SMR63812.1 unnamed protein product [Zymoseptoria tritici ST99CH_3D1]
MARTTATTTKPRKQGLLSKLRGNKTHSTTHVKKSHNPITGTTTTKQTTTTTPHATHSHGTRGATGAHHTTTAAPVHHQRRKPTMGDKLSGAMMKLSGTLTRKPGKKAAGTRRMNGTDGKGSHRVA